MLRIIFDRLYTLRNQIFHGGSTFSGGWGQAQVHDGCRIMASLVPVVLEIMQSDMDGNPDNDTWESGRVPAHQLPPGVERAGERSAPPPPLSGTGRMRTTVAYWRSIPLSSPPVRIAGSVSPPVRIQPVQERRIRLDCDRARLAPSRPARTVVDDSGPACRPKGLRENLCYDLYT